MRLELSWVVKAVAVLAMTAPWVMWGQVQAAPAAWAGVDAAGNPTTVEAAMRSLMAQSGVAFVGTVTGIRRVEGDGFAAAAGVVEVSFAVERGLRGVADGESYVLREWGGLWSASGAGSAARYTVGSRLLLLLHAPGPTGLSSPVGGMDGVIPVKGTSPLVAAESETVAENAPVVDLRWLAAKLAHPVSYGPARSVTLTGLKAQTRASNGVRGTAKPGGAGQTAVSAADEMAAMREASVPTAQASVATVLQMMAGWAKETNDAR